MHAEGGRTTKITVLMGSPNAMGSTGILVDCFQAGAMTRTTRYPDEAYRLGKSLR